MEINEAIERAQEIARKKGLKIGQIVCHPDDEYTYKLKEIKGNEAIVWFPGQNETIKTFPLEELFDPEVVIKLIIEGSNNSALKKFVSKKE